MTALLAPIVTSDAPATIAEFWETASRQDALWSASWFVLVASRADD